MNTAKTYTFEARHSGFYTWKPRVIIHDSAGSTDSHHVSESTYRRFVRLANSGRYNVTVADAESVAWQLSRKPQLSFVMQLEWPQRQQA